MTDRTERNVAEPSDFPTSWFIGDSVLTRYGTDTQVRVLPQVPSPGVHRFRVTQMSSPGRVHQREEFRDDLVSALRLGEEWIP